MRSLLFSGALGASLLACTGPARDFPAETGSGGSGTTSTEAGPGSTGSGGDAPSSSSTSSSSSSGDGGSGVGGSGEGGAGQGGFGQGGSGQGGAGGGVVSGVEVTVPTDAVVVRTDDSVTVEVTVERSAPDADAAVITVDGLPEGVTADPLEIPADETTGELTLHGAVDALQGLATAEVVAAADDLEDTASLALIVAGAPGSADQTFTSASGTYAMQVASDGTRGRAITIQPDGKILVAGGTDANELQMVAIRLDELGVPDDGFGDEGVFVGGVGQSGALAVAVEASGRVLLGGFGYRDFKFNQQFAITALTALGVTDVDYAVGGHALSGQLSGFGQFRALFPTATGVLGLGEFFSSSNNNQFARVYEYVDATATLTMTHQFDGESIGFYAQQPDGKLLYGGRDSSNSMFITRLSAPNTLDGTFNFSGTKAVFFDGRAAIATGAVVDSNGRILVGGYSDAAGESLVSLVKLNADGNFAATFGVGGKLVTTVAMATQSSSSIAIDSEGRILFGGYVGTTTRTPAVARFNPDGTADLTFGTSGRVVLDSLAVVPDNNFSSVWGIVVDDLDRVLVVGEFGSAASPTLFVSRLWF